MKKVLVLTLVTIMLLTMLVGCGNHNNPTEPTQPSITTPTEPTTPSQGGDVTQPTEPEATRPPEPEIYKPDIPVREDGSLQLSALGYDEAYNALRYIRANLNKYNHSYIIARGVYHETDGMYTFSIPTLDQYYDAEVPFVLSEDWLADPANANLQVQNGDTILLSGHIAIDNNGEMYISFANILGVY